MKNRYAQILQLLLIFSCTAVESSLAMPTLKIRRVENHTPFDLGLIDRINNTGTAISSMQGFEYTDYTITQSRNIVINGSMKDVMIDYAQFQIQSIDKNMQLTENCTSYMNICLLEGGINDGSGFITGTKGSIVLKFLFAGSNSGCVMSSGPLKLFTLAANANPNNTTEVKTQKQNSVVIDLLFYMDTKDKSCLKCEYTMHEIVAE